MKRNRQISENPIPTKEIQIMENIIEIRNRRIAIDTARRREDYCKTAILFEVLDGSVTFFYDQHETVLNKQGILVINKGTEYRYEASEDIILASLELMGKTFESACDGVRQMVLCNSADGDNERYASLRVILRQMILNQAYVMENEEQYSYLVFDYYSQYYKLLETIVSYFLSDNESRKLSDGKIRNADRMAQIERYLNVHYAEAVSLEQIADELYLSKGYLSRFFANSFGMTFSQYIKELRLRRSMSDLLYTDKPITQVAFDNGFTSSSFFNRSFREKYRKNPSEIRKEFAEKEENRNKTDVSKAELNERVNRLLDYDGKPAGSINREERYVYSAADNVPMKRIWNRVINIGSAADILGSDIQEHLVILEKAARFDYARFWDPFSKNMNLDVNKISDSYNFHRLDQALDRLLASGMKPFIAFEPKLDRINEELGTVLVRNVQEKIINSPEAWASITGAFVRHIIQKYGIEEVEQWIFELPFGIYEIKDMEPVEGYIALFTSLYDIVRKYTFNLKVGGPTVTSADKDILQKILDVLQERKKMPDYISFISFAYEADWKERRYTIRSGDEDYLIHDIAKIKQFLKETGYDDLPVYVTEWNETVSDRNYINDTCYRGAYIIRSMIGIGEGVEAAGYFSGTDQRSEYFDSHLLLQGGNGLLSRNGIIKPSGLAMQLMNRLGNYKIASDSHFLITTDRRHNYYIAAHNKRKLGYYYYKTPENAIEKEKILKYCEDESYLEQDIELTDISNGEYRIRTLKVNAHHGSVMDIWKELGYSGKLSEKDIRYIQKVCEPHLQLEDIAVKDNRIRLKLTMEPNEITLVEIKWLFT